MVDAIELIDLGELIEPGAAEIELGHSSSPTLDLGPRRRPAHASLDLDDDSAFGSITARSLPPTGVIDETERVPVVELAEPAARAPTTAPALEPRRPELVPAPARIEQPATPRRIEPGRSGPLTGPLSPVRVSFVSARGPAPTLPPPSADRVGLLDLSSPRPERLSAHDLLTMDALETPPGGISTFDDLGLPANSYNNNAGPGGFFVSGGNAFNNSYSPAFGGIWSGWSISSMTDTTTSGSE